MSRKREPVAVDLMAALQESLRVSPFAATNVPAVSRSSERSPETCRDPHHDGTAEWKWEGGQLFHRGVHGVGEWTEAKRIHATPARIRTLAALLDSAAVRSEEHGETPSPYATLRINADADAALHSEGWLLGCAEAFEKYDGHAIGAKLREAAAAIRSSRQREREALEWWNRQGRFLEPREGDDAAWDEYVKNHVPSWVSGSEAPVRG